jgi:sec-independent protein translocase protein TatC
VSPRLHPEFLPTVAVFVVVTFVAGALLTPPDPFTQLLYAAPGVVLSVLLAALLTYGSGYERLGISPSGRDHTWTAVGFLVGSGLVGLLVPDPTAVLGNVASLVAGLLVGAWLGWARGRERLGFRSRNA